VRVDDLRFEPDGPGDRIDDIDHLGEQMGGVLVAGMVGERGGDLAQFVDVPVGAPIDPEQSTMMISAALATSSCPLAAEPAEVTVTMALTSRAPAGRYSFWKTSTVKSGALIVARSRDARRT
jgi:hypothetical protein